MSNCRCQCLKALSIYYSLRNLCEILSNSVMFSKLNRVRKTDFWSPWSACHMGKVEKETGTRIRQHEKWWLCLAWAGLVLSSMDFQLPKQSIQALNLPLLVSVKENLPINPHKNLCNPDQSVISPSVSIRSLTSWLSRCPGTDLVRHRQPMPTACKLLSCCISRRQTHCKSSQNILFV